MSKGNSMSWTVEATTGSMPPVGLYIADIKELSDPEPPQFTEYGDTDQVKFTFTIVSVIDSDDETAADFVGEDAFGWANYTFGPKAKLRAWAQAALGREIQDGEKISAEDIEGTRVRLTIGLTETGKRKVAGLQPYRKASNGKKGAKPAPPVEQDVEYDDEAGEDPF